MSAGAAAAERIIGCDVPRPFRADALAERSSAGRLPGRYFPPVLQAIALLALGGGVWWGKKWAVCAAHSRASALSCTGSATSAHPQLAVIESFRKRKTARSDLLDARRTGLNAIDRSRRGAGFLEDHPFGSWLTTASSVEDHLRPEKACISVLPAVVQREVSVWSMTVLDHRTAINRWLRAWTVSVSWSR